MHHFGFVKVAAAVPVRYRYGSDVLLSEHRQLISAAIARNTEVLAFPAMSLLGCWEDSDLYQDEVLLAATQALSALLAFTASSDLVLVAGLPVLNRNRLYAAAAVLQRGRILAVIPQDAEDVPGDIALLQQTVPFSPDCLVRTKSYVMGVIVGDDPCGRRAAALTRQGATLLVQIDDRPYTAGAVQAAKAALSSCSACTHTGYVYVNAGAASDASLPLCAGDCYIYEDGVLLKESTRFARHATLLLAEVDGQAVKKRQRMCRAACTPHIEVTAKDAAWQMDKLSRQVSQTPYVAQADAALAEILHMQGTLFCNTLQANPTAHLTIAASGRAETALVMLSCKSAIEARLFERQTVTVAISDDMRDLKGASGSMLAELAEKWGFGVSNRIPENSVTVRTAHLSDIAFGSSISNGLYPNASLPKMAIYKMLEAAEVTIPKEILHLGLSETGQIAYDFFLYYRLRYGFEKEKLLFLASQAFSGVYDEQQLHTLYQYFDSRCIPTGQIIRQMGQDYLGICCH